MTYEWDDDKDRINKEKHDGKGLFLPERLRKPKKRCTFMIMTADELKNLPSLSEEDRKVIQNAKATPTEDCPEMNAEEMKEFKPWYDRTKKPVTINMDTNVISYFKNLSKETGVPYQTLINLYLSQCVNERKRPIFA